MAASWAPPAGDLAHNPGMCPDQELNRQPLGSQAGTPSTELYQPGLMWVLTDKQEFALEGRLVQVEVKAYEKVWHNWGKGSWRPDWGFNICCRGSPGFLNICVIDPFRLPGVYQWSFPDLYAVFPHFGESERVGLGKVEKVWDFGTQSSL